MYVKNNQKWFHAWWSLSKNIKIQHLNKNFVCSTFTIIIYNMWNLWNDKNYKWDNYSIPYIKKLYTEINLITQ